MGNQIDRLTHHRYDEVPLSDPSYPDSESGSAYVDSDTNTTSSLDVQQLHTGEGGSAGPAERATPPQHIYDYEEHTLREELHFTAYCAGECIFCNARCASSSSSSSSSSFLTPADLLEASVAGDLLEFTAPGPVSDGVVGGSSCTHWAVSTGDGRAVYLHHSEVRSDPVSVLSAGRRGRVVSDWYRFKAQSAETVVRRALDQVLLQQQLQQQRQQEVVMVNGGDGDDEWRQVHGGSWRNSECFAAWCRYGKRQFKSGLELRIGKTPYLLQTHLGDGVATTQSFQCLEDLIVERWRLERIGRSALLLDSGFAQKCCGL